MKINKLQKIPKITKKLTCCFLCRKETTRMEKKSWKQRAQLIETDWLNKRSNLTKLPSSLKRVDKWHRERKPKSRRICSRKNNGRFLIFFSDSGLRSGVCLSFPVGKWNGRKNGLPFSCLRWSDRIEEERDSPAAAPPPPKKVGERVGYPWRISTNNQLYAWLRDMWPPPTDRPTIKCKKTKNTTPRAKKLTTFSPL